MLATTILRTLALALAAAGDAAGASAQAAPVQIEGATACPEPRDVADELARVAAHRTDAAGPPEVVTLFDEGDAIRVRLRRADGALIGERTIAALGACADRAASLAVVIATWRAELTSGLVPQGPGTLASLEGTDRRAGAGPSVQAAVWLVAARPSQTAFGGRVGVAGVQASGLGVRAGAWGTTGRSEAFPGGAGDVRWTRLGLGLGPTFQVLRGPGATVVLFAGADLARLYVAGAGFPDSRTDASWELGVHGGVEVGVRSGSWNPSVGLGVAYWPRAQAAVALGVDGGVTLPSVDVIASLGLGWGSAP